MRLLIAFSFLFLFCNKIEAQSRNYLSVGSKIPEVEIKKIINFYKDKARLSDFKGKALLLNFWAPWCSPCIAAFPKLDSIQSKYLGQFNVLSVTTEEKQYVATTLSNLRKSKKIKLVTSVVEDSVLSRLFKHKTIPFYVWIDSTGTIKAMTESKEVTESNIYKLINGSNLNLDNKEEFNVISWHFNTPLFANNPELLKNPSTFYSVITKYDQRVSSYVGQRDNIIGITSCPIIILYRIAFGKFDPSFLDPNRTNYEGFNHDDSIAIGGYTTQTRSEWLLLNRSTLYNYELVVPDSMFTRDEKFEIMQQDLNKYFKVLGIHGRLEKRSVKTLSLVKISVDDSNLKTKGGRQINQHSDYYINLKNQPLNILVMTLQAFYPVQTHLPIVDETGYRQNIDIEISGDVTNVLVLNQQLEKYGLKLVENTRELDMLVMKKW